MEDPKGTEVLAIFMGAMVVAAIVIYSAGYFGAKF